MTALGDGVTATTAVHRVGARVLVSMIAGRTVLRLLAYASGVIFAAVWSGPDFARYAAALGTAVWLTPLIQTGPEKTALKLIPRSVRTRGQIIGLLRTVVLVVPVPLLAATALAVALAPTGTATLYLAAAAYQIALGCNLLAIALYRAIGQTGRDVADYAVLSAGSAVLIAVVTGAHLPPIGYLCGLLVLTHGLTIGLARGLPRRPTRRGIRRIMLRTAVLMGSSEVLSNAATSVLYVELVLTGQGGQSGSLYLASLGWSALINVAYFVQRIFQPVLSARLARVSGPAAWAMPVRLARWVAWLSVAWLVVVPAGLAIGAAHGVSRWPLLVIAALMLSRVPFYLATAYAVYVLENTDADGLRICAAGAVLGMAAVAATGLVLIPLFGAAGAVCALATNQLCVVSTILRRWRSDIDHS